MNKLTNTLILIAITSSLGTISNSAVAVDGLSANVGFTNNYLWRGLEQTNGKPAISGGIDYETGSGFYVGTWVSNADWATGMTYELDLYGGYSAAFNNLTYDIGFVHYAYPDSIADVDFTEINASISYSVFTLAYAVLASADGADFADDSYISLDGDFTFSTDTTVTLHIGASTDEFYAGESFVDYGASISKSGFTFAASKTDLDDSDIKVVISYGIDFDW